VSDRILRSAFAAFLLLGLAGACSEQVTGSLGCPALCTDQSAALRDTILTGSVVVDTSFYGFPRLGEDRDVTLINRGDTADVRLIARYDSLPRSYFLGTATADSTIRRVDSAQMIFVIDTLTAKSTAPITIDAFDVDTTANDTLNAALVPLFRAERLIGSQTYQAADLKDTLKLSLDNAAIFAKIKDTLRLRIGLRIRGTGSVKLPVQANLFVPRLRFRVSADTTVKPDTVFPRSLTPTDDVILQSVLPLYRLVVKGQLGDVPADRFAIGGLRGARTYIRFDIPSVVLDSVQVIRASLVLTQAPTRSLSKSDTITVFTQPVLASPALSDLFTAATFLGSPYLYGVDSLRFAVKDSGQRSIELVNLVRYWRLAGLTNTSRSIVLRSPQEGALPGELSFFSTEAPASVRPRLRLTYVPRRGFGIP
jgi:hypothetical protein